MQKYDAKKNSRRNFLRASAIGTVGTLAMPAVSASECELAANLNDEENAADRSIHRIQKLSLKTASPLPEMAVFYRDILEMQVQLTEERLVVEAGGTQITFTPAREGRPFYHFAFNIPENKILSARKWLGERTKLSTTPVKAREKGLPNDVRPFGFWNSHSIFFRDPAGNILELICRHDLNNGTKGDFRRDEILYASEIGLVTSGTVNELAGQIKSTYQLAQYRGGGDSFRAIGDETGLIILFQQGGTPVGAKAGQSWTIFPTDVTVRPEIKLENKKWPHSIGTS